jgi:hypothetical protein
MPATSLPNVLLTVGVVAMGAVRRRTRDVTAIRTGRPRMTDLVALKQVTNASLMPCEVPSSRARRSQARRLLLLFPALEHLYFLLRLRLHHPSQLPTLSVTKLRPDRSLCHEH